MALRPLYDGRVDVSPTIEADVAAIRVIVERLEQSSVTRAEFLPVRAIAYGIVGIIMVAFVGAVGASVLR